MSQGKKPFYIPKKQLVAMVERLQHGESGAKEETIGVFRDKIFGHIVKRIDNPNVDSIALAEELTDKVFDEIFDNIYKLRKPEAFVTWCNRIVENKVKSHFREYRKRVAAEYEFGVGVLSMHGEPNNDDSIVKGWLDQIPVKQANAVRMHHLEGLSVKAIAQSENVSVGTIKSRLFYGRKALEKIILTKEEKK